MCAVNKHAYQACTFSLRNMPAYMFWSNRKRNMQDTTLLLGRLTPRMQWQQQLSGPKRLTPHLAGHGFNVALALPTIGPARVGACWFQRAKRLQPLYYPSKAVKKGSSKKGMAGNMGWKARHPQIHHFPLEIRPGPYWKKRVKKLVVEGDENSMNSESRPCPF